MFNISQNITKDMDNQPLKYRKDFKPCKIKFSEQLQNCDVNHMSIFQSDVAPFQILYEAYKNMIYQKHWHMEQQRQRIQ